MGGFLLFLRADVWGVLVGVADHDRENPSGFKDPKGFEDITSPSSPPRLTSPLHTWLGRHDATAVSALRIELGMVDV